MQAGHGDGRQREEAPRSDAESADDGLRGG